MFILGDASSSDTSVYLYSVWGVGHKSGHFTLSSVVAVGSTTNLFYSLTRVECGRRRGVDCDNRGSVPGETFLDGWSTL